MGEPSRWHTTSEGDVKVARFEKKGKSHFLQLVEGEGAPARFELSKEEMTVGRGAGEDITLASDKVSCRHAVIRRRNQEYTLLDLDSLHGVYLNGLKIHSAVLRDDDILQLADAVFIYREG